MELTPKGIAAVIIPAIVMLSGNAIDNSMKWRAELEQKAYDRQIRILDKILEIPQAEHRISAAEFYLRTNTFSGQYRRELEISIEIAKEEIAKQKMEAELLAKQEERKPKAVIRKNQQSIPKPSEEVVKIKPTEPVPESIVLSEQPTPGNVTLGNGILPSPKSLFLQAPKISEPEVITLQEPKIDIPIQPEPQAGSSNIFSYDKKN